MKRVAKLEGKGNIVVEEVEIPEIADNEVLVRNERSGRLPVVPKVRRIRIPAVRNVTKQAGAGFIGRDRAGSSGRKIMRGSQYIAGLHRLSQTSSRHQAQNEE